MGEMKGEGGGGGREGRVRQRTVVLGQYLNPAYDSQDNSIVSPERERELLYVIIHLEYWICMFRSYFFKVHANRSKLLTATSKHGGKNEADVVSVLSGRKERK